MTGPLRGYRILELTSTVSGPMAAMLLADQGADVIKVEPPPGGDPARFMGSLRNGMGSMFAVLNRNKRSLALDLKDPADMAIFRQMARNADVLIENYRPGIVGKLGIDYETLSKDNPRLIYISISGYGQDGPYKNRRVYDPLIQATTGIAHAQGQGEPRNVQCILYDKVTGMMAAQVATAALLDRERTGEGQYLPISMLDSALYYNWPDVMWSRTMLGEDMRHAGELADYFQIFEAKDGHVSIVLVADAALELLSVWRQSEIHLDARFRTLPDRLAHPEEFKSSIETLLADVTVDEICENLDAFGVPVARVNSLDDLHEDPQVIQQQTLVETTHPVVGELRMPRPPFRFRGQEDDGAFPARHAAFLGDHARDILTEVDIEPSEIERVEKRDRTNREIVAAAIAAAMGGDTSS